MSAPPTYVYQLAHGEPYLGVHRTPDKQFRQSHWTGSAWEKGAPEGPKIPYRLNELMGAKEILIAEGEKDVDTLVELGFVATSNPGGAGNWVPELNPYLTGKIVYFLQDRDESSTGEKHRRLVAENLSRYAAEVRIIDLPELPSGAWFKDITQWIELGGDAVTLNGTINHAPLYEPQGYANGAEIDLVTLLDVDPKPIAWLWPGYIARRKLTLIAGEPGLGKSQIGLDVVARITSARPWPNEGRAPLGSCVILSAEDAIDDVLRPRLEAAGADLARVHAIRNVSAQDRDGKLQVTIFSLQHDLDLLGEKIKRIGDVMLVVIDPITAYFGDNVDTHKTAAVRSVLALLDRFAESHNVAVLGITHPPKVVAGGKAINAMTGSLAFVAAARIAFIAVEDIAVPGRRLLLPIKNNLGANADGLAYRVNTRITSSNLVSPFLVWDSASVSITANEALAAASEAAKERGGAMREATQFLRDLIEDGPVLATEATEKAKAKGFSEKTLERARKRLGVVAEKDGFQGRWAWRLP